MLTILIGLLFAGIVCDFEDTFSDDLIGSDWLAVHDPSGTVAVDEFADALQLTFGTRVPSEDDQDIAGVMSLGWGLDMTQEGGFTLDFIETAWPSGDDDSIGVGVLIYDGTDLEGEPNAVLEFTRGVRNGELFMRLGPSDESENVDAADLDSFDGVLVVWWKPDVGVFAGWSLSNPIEGGAWDEVFSPDLSDSLGLALFGSNSGLTETLNSNAGFTNICVMPPNAPYPDLCDTDVNPNYEIDVFDLEGVLNAWGTTCADCRADTNGDGHVNMLDLMGVLTTWGGCLIPT